MKVQIQDGAFIKWRDTMHYDDDAGLQPQTRVEPGELPKTDGGSGLKARRQRRRSKKAVNGNL